MSIKKFIKELFNPYVSKEYCLKNGFGELPHFTVTNSLIYKLNRERYLSVSCVGTPNEMLFICEVDINNTDRITELVCLHNYDYDHYLTKKKLRLLLKVLK